MGRKEQASDIPFRKFLGFVVVLHFVFALPVFIILLILRLLPFDTILFLFLPISGLGIPLSAGFGYLMAKGSNWVNTRSAEFAVGILPGQTYGVLLGGFLGHHFWAMTGGVIGGIIFFVTGSLAGGIVANTLIERELAAKVARKPHT